MNCRRHGSKPTLALWMLVACADIAIVAAAAGPITVLLVLAGLLVAAGGVYAARSLGNRAPADSAARRRA
ncbi:hypothetical protein ACWT_7590 [Actinoplanes sp. SE50]|uniref:hypothetical protein n=1 Tax=unclassified Actinoplanes TaxID=2626549 RepID=UPI00023EDD6E|nr:MULTISPECIES: hypothetical protein [unclassified Actinoplanes]AEV88600.1 hypothetical protein ACPL_7720 [Actinoplanes sp. SE50/110]ATO87005.1 hypothetical protein ACWT_7590 [Actinoplanes sp. SE50]SLM04423.1 hypothetical protein ACSP50_7728 [Actinoplanes sp. SE50/110]